MGAVSNVERHWSRRWPILTGAGVAVVCLVVVVVPYLIKALDHRDVRIKAIQSLGELGPEANSAVPDLINLWKENDISLKGYTEMALNQIDQNWKQR